MKFKCSVNEIEKMGELMSIVNCLSRYSDKLILIARTESLTLTIRNDPMKSFIWFDINAGSFFKSYLLEGVDPTDENADLIYLEINCNYLLTALNTSRKNAKSIEIKLGRAEFPFIIVSMNVETSANKSATITNQVPVMILPRNTWDEISLPYDAISFTVQGKCPRFSVFKKFISLFKNQKIIKFTLRDDETLTIEVNEDTSSHFTIFDKIQVFNYGEKDAYKGESVSATVEQKKISHWIHALSFQSTPQLSIMMEPGKHLKLFFRIRDDIMAQFIVASVFTEDELSENEDFFAIPESDEEN